MTGAELFVKALKMEQVDTLFAYPGGQAIDLFNALYGERDIDVILPRHEQGLVHAADGYARSTGKTGVCLVTSGPGATNLVTGIATANYDSVPLVCFTGQVPTGLIGNDAFQEVDIVGITRNICKYAVTVRKRGDLAETIKKAFYIARTGKPGVVVIDLPKDVQQAYGSDEYPDEVEIRGYKPKVSVHAGQIKKAVEVLNRAKKPVFLIGGGVIISRAQDEMQRLAEATGVPVITTIMGKGAIPTTHDLYIGNIGIHGSYAANTAVSQCDVLFSIGTRFNDRITGKIGEFAPHAAIIHVDIDPASISRNIAVDIPIVADAKSAISALLEKAQPGGTGEWLEEINGWKQQHPISMGPEGLTPQKIISAMNDAFDNVIIATDVGQNQLWATQFLELGKNRQLLTSGGHRGQNRKSRQGCDRDYRRRRHADEHTGDGHRRLLRTASHHLHFKQRLSGKCSAVAGNVFQQALFRHLYTPSKELPAGLQYPGGLLPGIHAGFYKIGGKLRRTRNPRHFRNGNRGCVCNGKTYTKGAHGH